jgi:hypothetical protein
MKMKESPNTGLINKFSRVSFFGPNLFDDLMSAFIAFGFLVLAVSSLYVLVNQ